MKTKETTTDIRALRKKLGLNQSQFWGKVGLSQSCGSRHESSRESSEPIAKLIELVHVKGIDVDRITADDWSVAQYLRENNLPGFRELAKLARAAQKAKG